MWYEPETAVKAMMAKYNKPYEQIIGHLGHLLKMIDEP